MIEQEWQQTANSKTEANTNLSNKNKVVRPIITYSSKTSAPKNIMQDYVEWKLDFLTSREQNEQIWNKKQYFQIQTSISKEITQLRWLGYVCCMLHVRKNSVKKIGITMLKK